MIPKWIYLLMVEERERTRMMIMPVASDELRGAKCPKKLEADLAEVPYEGRQRVVCMSYERGKEKGKIPSARYCPNCPYNLDRLLKR